MIKIKDLLHFEQQILASILLVYHSVIWQVDEGYLQFSLIFILYGLFLLWQPVWNKEVRISKFPILSLAVIFLTISYYFPNESLVFFGLIICGLIGSRLLTESTFRSFDLLALLIIILNMVVGLVPDTFNQIDLPVLFAEYMQTLILILILLFYFSPNPDYKKLKRSQVDLMHGLLASTLIFIVLLGGIVINLLYGVDYIDGLLLTVFIVSTLTIGISWFWNPGVGYSGIGVLWNRYAMTIGGPFETWINTLTTLIEERYLTPIEYLEAACEHLVENEWLNAIQWNFENIKLTSGKKIGTRLVLVINEEVSADLYFKSNPGTALEQHTFLLIRMAYQFYLAKLNQEKMRAQEHFATIHHTGARLTHDIKNILQSIKTSIDILEHGKDPNKHDNILQANLNQISTRLESTLDKLKAPRLHTQISLIDCNQWIKQQSDQYKGNLRLRFHNDIEHNIPIPIDLFDSVTENLVNNALRKTSSTEINIRLLVSTEVIVVSVCDNGEKLDSSIEANLFQQPVSSGTGMGIGLYQASIMAHAFNFELELSQNETGKVCFNLFQHLSE
ncbi:MAG: signal transduction histidine kinase [Gammaproteobacteria bacterium]